MVTKLPRKADRARGALALRGALARAQAQDSLLAADEDTDRIGLDVLADDSGAAHVADHFPFLTGFKRAVVNDRQAMIGGPGNAIELQLHDGGSRRLVSLDHYIVE